MFPIPLGFNIKTKMKKEEDYRNDQERFYDLGYSHAIKEVVRFIHQRILEEKRCAEHDDYQEQQDEHNIIIAELEYLMEVFCKKEELSK